MKAERVSCWMHGPSTVNFQRVEEDSDAAVEERAMIGKD